MRDSSSLKGARYTTVRRGGQMALAYAPGAKGAAVLVSLMRFARWPDRSVCVPRAVIAEDTGLNEKQIRNAIYGLLHTRAPDPETGEPVALLELERAGGRGRATSYRLNVANVDGCPMGYQFANLGASRQAPNGEPNGVGASRQAPNGEPNGVGASRQAPNGEPNGVGASRQAIGAASVNDGSYQASPLKNKRNKKIKEEEEEEEEEERPRPHEFLERDQFRVSCRACGGSHVFTLADSTRGRAFCTAKGRTVTAEVPSGLRVMCDVCGYRLEREGAA